MRETGDITTMTSPAATIIIGVFNRARQIIPCLNSLLASTEQELEIVLVEDASQDNSAEVLRQFVSDHPERNIALIRNAQNRGASGARNVGIGAAQGEYLLFTDSDCIVKPDWVEEMVKGFKRTGAAAVSGTVFDKPPTNIAERMYIGSCNVIRKTPNLMESNMGLRRDIGFGFDPALFGGEGDDLAKRLRAHGHKIALVPDAVVIHNHSLDLASYRRMTAQQARGHTFYWYKHGIFLGRDIAAMGGAILSLPLVFIDLRLAWIPAVFFLLQIAAIFYNEMYYKGKPLREAVIVLPLAIYMHAWRALISLATWVRIILGLEPEIRSSRRAWLAERRSLGTVPGSRSGG